jgi:hypothetical protein
MGLGWTAGEAKDGTASVTAELSGLDVSPDREGGLRFREVVILRDIVVSKGNDEFGDDSGLEWPERVNEGSGFWDCIAWGATWWGEGGEKGEYEGILRSAGNFATVPHVQIMLIAGWMCGRATWNQAEVVRECKRELREDGNYKRGRDQRINLARYFES